MFKKGFLFLLPFLFLVSCKSPQPQVVIYASIDQHVAEPILREFELKSGIKVLPVYDVEAAKTTGMVNRLIAEKDRPQADVFWNGEFAQTIALQNKGVLQPYFSSEAVDTPKEYKDGQGYWTGFGGRARVLLANISKIGEGGMPESYQDVVSEHWDPRQIAIAYPQFGTTATHAAALYALLGPEKARAYFLAIKNKGVRIVDGNSVVRDLVASGQIAWGYTDTDDACGAIEKGAPVRAIFPDQGEDAIGTLIIPNTVALLANAPHVESGKKLIDYLLAKQTEKQLVENGWFSVPLREVGATSSCYPDAVVKGMSVSLQDIYTYLEQAKKETAEIVIR